MTVYQIDHKEFTRNLKNIDTEVLYTSSACGKYVYCTSTDINDPSKSISVRNCDDTAYIIHDDRLYKLGKLKPAEANRF